MHLFDLNKDVIAVEQSYALQCKRFETFKAQDLETGKFDVTFEVDGKKLYAHKFILTPVSEPLDAWLSDRWSKKNQPIKIESFSHDHFYQFLCFLYSGYCELSEENIFPLINMAEFYDVALLKEFCSKTLAMHLSVENLEDSKEAAERYALPELLHNVEYFASQNIHKIVKRKEFKDHKKPFVEFLCTLERSDLLEEDFFVDIYEWAEHQVDINEMNEETVDLQAATRNVLNAILPHIHFTIMDIDFLMAYVVERGFLLSPSELAEHFPRASWFYDNCELTFTKLYQLSEKVVLQKQKMDPVEDFNLENCVRNQLAEVIPLVKFYEMEKEFLMNFVVANGLITEEQANHVYDTRVEVENDGNIITGIFNDYLGIRNAMNWLNLVHFNGDSRKDRKFRLQEYTPPPIPSTVKKMENIDWYLCLDEDGILTFMHHSIIDERDYLICEMKSESKFYLNPMKMTKLRAYYNNI